MDFPEQINNLLKQNRGNQERIFGAAVLQMQRMVVSGTSSLPGTPVDTNQARSNWFVEVDGTSGRITTDTSTRNLSMASAAVVSALSGSVKPRYFSLFNNLPYIRHLEYGLYPNPPKHGTGKTIGGYSTQAPQGMFRVAVQQWGNIVTEVSGKQGKKT